MFLKNFEGDSQDLLLNKAAAHGMPSLKKFLIFILIRYIVFHIMEITQVEKDRML